MNRIRKQPNWLYGLSIHLRGKVSISRKIGLRLELLEARDLPSNTASIATPIDVFQHASSGIGNGGYSPSQIASAYGISSITFSGGVTGNGSGETIALVDAYNDPNITGDLAAFDAEYGLAAPPSFEVVNQNGQTTGLPRTDPGTLGDDWELEESLDVEWAHAIAPSAGIVLVEATNDYTTNLLAAATTGARIANVVSMSWGIQGGFPGETSYDSDFNISGVTFVAAAGDNGAPASYPAESPYVVAVGGTTLALNGASYGSETAWSYSGGGLSTYESRPSFQNGVSSVVGSQRGSPDVSFDADPNTGVEIYDSYDAPAFGGEPWIQIGGTSVGAPTWAGLVAIADQGRVNAGLGTLSSTQTLNALYGLSSSDFHEISNGGNGTYSAQAGYNLVTGLGTPVANLLVPALAGQSNGGSGSGGSGSSGSGGSGSGSGGSGGAISGSTYAPIAFQDNQAAYVEAFDAYVTGSGSYAAFYYSFYAYYYSYYAYYADSIGLTSQAEYYAYGAYFCGYMTSQYAYGDWIQSGSFYSYAAYYYAWYGSLYSYMTAQGD